jgi:DNA-binding beta-propeller fold protein YncE
MRRSRGALVLAAAAVAAAATWAVATGEGRQAAGPAASPPPPPVVARIDLPGKPRQLAVADDGLWVVTDRGLHRIDPAANRLVASVPVGTATVEAGGLAVSGDAVWVPGERSRSLWRVDRASGRIAGRVGLGQVLYGPVGVAASGDTVWVTCCALRHGERPAGTLLRVDGHRGRVTHRVPVPDGPLAVAAGRDGVWVGTGSGALLQVDPASGRVRRRVPPADPRGRVQALSPAPGVLWVADTGAGAIRRLDPAAGRYDLGLTAPLPRNLGAGPDPDRAWAVTDPNQLLSVVDAAARRRSRPVPLSQLGGVRGVAVGAGAVWVTTGGQVVRVDPARVPG